MWPHRLYQSLEILSLLVKPETHSVGGGGLQEEKNILPVQPQLGVPASTPILCPEQKESRTEFHTQVTLVGSQFPLSSLHWDKLCSQDWGHSVSSVSHLCSPPLADEHSAPILVVCGAEPGRNQWLETISFLKFCTNSTLKSLGGAGIQMPLALSNQGMLKHMRTWPKIMWSYP